MKRFFLCAVIAGALFGMGLVLSCMTDPERVIVFLDVFGDFDPTLAFVLGGSVLVTVISFRFILRMRSTRSSSAARHYLASAGAWLAIAPDPPSRDSPSAVPRHCGSSVLWSWVPRCTDGRRSAVSGAIQY